MVAQPGRFVYWTPRVLSILFILFLALFSLDVFDEGLGFWGTLLGLFMHNIPSLILLVVLVISWKREIVVGITFIIGGFLYVALVLNNIFVNGFEWYYLAWIAQISSIPFIIGIFFLIGWRRRKNSLKNSLKNFSKDSSKNSRKPYRNHN